MAAQLAQLHQPDRGLHVGHPVVEADLQVALDHRLLAGVALRRAHVHAVLAQPPQPGGDVRVRGDDHPALTGGEELARVEGEGGQGRRRADRPAPVHRARRAGGVLDHGDAPRLAERPDGVQVGGHAGLVDHDDRPGARRSGAARSSPGPGSAVAASTSAKTGVRPHVADRVRGGDERQRRDHDLVPGADPGGDERQVQRGRARGHGDRVPGADRARRTRPRTRATRGPCATQPEATAAAAACASSSPSHGRITGMVTARLAQSRRGPPAPGSAPFARSARHQETSLARPSSRPTSAFQPRRSAAAETSASRRVTPLTLRAGPNSGSRSTAHDLERASRRARAGWSRSRCRC